MKKGGRNRKEEKSLQKKNKEEKALDIQVKTGENGIFQALHNKINVIRMYTYKTFLSRTKNTNCFHIFFLFSFNIY